jgi:hypothetical protein
MQARQQESPVKDFEMIDPSGNEALTKDPCLK